LSGLSAPTLCGYLVSQDRLKELFVGQLFYASALAELPPGNSVVSEINKLFAKKEKKTEKKEDEKQKEARLDFWVNGSLKWAVELLIGGRGAQEHLERFGARGKYSFLAYEDYIVLDFKFRKGKKASINHDKYVQVVFDTECNKASCYINDKLQFVVKLRQSQ